MPLPWLTWIKAISLDSNFAKAYSFRGAVHARQGRNELALADYDTLIRLLPSRAGAYKDRGGLLVRMRQFDRAIEDLDEAIRLDPKRASAYQNRGAAYNGLGRYEQAIDDLSKAIELDPDNAGAFTNRGLALFALGRYDQSHHRLERGGPACTSKRDSLLQSRRGLVAAGPARSSDRRITTRPSGSTRSWPLPMPRAPGCGMRDGQRDRAIRDYDMAL